MDEAIALCSVCQVRLSLYEMEDGHMKCEEHAPRQALSFDEKNIEVATWCPVCKAPTVTPVPYRVFVDWMNRTPLEELIEDERMIEVLTTGQCDEHSERN